MKTWWKEGIVYQIYPRSFQDSNGDGIGDIPGIISRLDEIAELGTRAIWLSPVYKSPQIDNGYDISDYYSIDPVFGTMADMERLIKEAKNRNIGIVMDLVVNHTSDEHEWFQKSRRREAPYEDYYIWKKSPNNWTSFFMEDAWEYDEVRGEYYLHLFHKKQPDLNYHNPQVIEEVKKILQFWLDKGVAGFRCDVINVLWKTSLEDGKKSIMLTGLEHYKCQEGNHEILRQLRQDVLDKYDCFTVGETAMVNLEEAKLLSDEARRELNMVFYFDHLEADRVFARFVPKKFRAKELLKRLAKWQQGLEWNALYLENHDQTRIVSHYGDDRGAGEHDTPWERSAKLMAALLLTLRGTPFIYQGQEIGMTNFDFHSLDQVKDIESHNLNRLMKKLHVPKSLRWKWLRLSSRDNSRTPYQWDNVPGAGFSSAAPWLGINANYQTLNHKAQKDDPDSVLSFYQRMINLRASGETLRYGEFKPLLATNSLLMYSREMAPVLQTAQTGMEKAQVFIAAFNFSSRRIKLSGEARMLLQGKVAVSNIGRTHWDNSETALEAWEALLLQVN
ncbi:MAG: alpha-glucosidase [Treponema sp.]|nr:alpha-glucosidase [Treponema sp.]